MNLRTTKLYKSMDNYTATAYAEGFDIGERATEKERLTAFQYLHDTGMAYKLQGNFGRTTQNLLAENKIQA